MCWAKVSVLEPGVNCFLYIIVIRQWFAHAHEDDIGNSCRL